MNRESRPILALPAFLQVLVLVIILQVAISRKVQAEENLDFKVMEFKESDGRVSVFSPTFLYKKEFSPDFSIQIDGIYNSISGATPTGAPPVPVYVTTVTTIPGSGGGSSSPQATTILAPAPSYGNDDDDEGGEDGDDDKFGHTGKRTRRQYYIARAGATPAAQPQPVASTVSSSSSGSGSGSGSSTQVVQTKTPAGSVIPTQKVVDERYGLNFGITRRINRNTLSSQLSFSTERDYQSLGVSLSDSVDMNNKNTILTGGLAFTHDVVDILADKTKKNKNSEDLLLGLTQYISPKTIFVCNLSFGFVNGYLTDPYKLVELNGDIVGEKRPDNKTKEVLYLGLTHHVEALAGTAEIGYRFYRDSYDITAHTFLLNWYQELGANFILRPSFRVYDQSESSFYDVRFTGTPEFFSSDFRVSALNAYSYGLKLIWFPSKRFAFDIAYENYQQQGKDGKTDDRMYPAANIFTAGGRVWF